MVSNPLKQSTSRRNGQAAENIARLLLIRNGLKLIARNYHCPRGELDLVMKEGDVWVMVEVRYRASDHYGSAAASITAGKRARLVASARYFLLEYARTLDVAMRFDVVVLTGSLDRPETRWIRCAFYADELFSN